MHTANLDLTLEEITKIEGNASLSLKIKDGQVLECKFGITEMKRFFTKALVGKPAIAVPQLVARVCGTCSNAHLLCSIKSIENGLKLATSPQTKMLQKLLNFGLIIRDHGLHLYVFVLPDLYSRDSILAFDEKNDEEHALLHDCFDVKEIGNKLGIATGGRSVHAPNVMSGGFTKIPTKESLSELLPELEKIRPRILHLIEVFRKCPWKQDIRFKFMGLIDKEYSFLEGSLRTSDNETITLEDFEKRLKRISIPYSQATGYYYGSAIYMVGALARMNLNSDAIHPKTKQDIPEALSLFPSTNIYHNNLAQAIEMLHALDSAADLIKSYEATPETPLSLPKIPGVGVGLIEAPRGTLYHRLVISDDGKVSDASIIVPTGQNQIGIEKVIRDYVTDHINESKETLTHEIEKIIRAYDPCMSCATHFLKIKWQ